MTEDYEFRCSMCKGQWCWKVKFGANVDWSCNAHLAEVLNGLRRGWRGIGPEFVVTGRI